MVVHTYICSMPPAPPPPPPLTHSLTAVIYFRRLLLLHLANPASATCITQLYLVYSCSTFATTHNKSSSFSILNDPTPIPNSLQMLSSKLGTQKMNGRKERKNSARNPQVCVTLTPCWFYYIYYFLYFSLPPAALRVLCHTLTGWFYFDHFPFSLFYYVFMYSNLLFERWTCQTYYYCYGKRLLFAIHPTDPTIAARWIEEKS